MANPVGAWDVPGQLDIEPDEPTTAPPDDGSNGIYATDLIWQFFQSHSLLPTATATPTPTSTPTVTPTPTGLIGAANKDGHVDPIDAALVLQYSAGLISTINPNADVNHDGQINSLDALLILQYVAGLLSHLPP